MTLGKMCISASVIKIESSVWYHFIKDGRVFGFRTRKEYSEAEAGPQPGGGHGSQGEFHSLNRILNIQ